MRVDHLIRRRELPLIATSVQDKSLSPLSQPPPSHPIHCIALLERKLLLTWIRRTISDCPTTRGTSMSDSDRDNIVSRTMQPLKQFYKYP
ncbi:hypothetical protein RSOLAG1IB_08429 [Rhizoctonia solani AG-1 IB]|uniref:Uncharacterized protein n=1 Tax=Thanatephorus cucumeris (strain AG1-IB / isolate 7/3/14) TaxID=1108050 RepID=A0A0B7FGS3_THACB|nr:hypothetical protein RSOLAG1IB_08429 [Rhizoctonia solani AG-1 IB]